MAKADNEQIKSGRERLLERAQGRYPDRHFVRQEGQDGQDGQLDDLDDAINEMMDEDASQIATNASMNEKLASILYRDPKVADFLNVLIETGDPRAALVETFGDELAELATEEGRGRFQSQLEGYRERVRRSEELKAEEQKNWEGFLERLDNWGNEHNLTDEEKASIAVRLIDIAQKGGVNMYDEDDFNTVWRGVHYEGDVEAARNEGLIAGRNEHIEAARRQRAAASSAGMPSISGGRGANMPAPKAPQSKSVWDEVE